MTDETTAPSVFRTGREDRTIPLVLGLLLALTFPVWPLVSGPFFWPWGAGAGTLALAGAILAFARWTVARRTVVWHGTPEILDFRLGRRSRRLALSDLTRIHVVPSALRTSLVTAESRWTLSHRLVRAEDLLQILRSRRPDLFPEPGETETFRASAAELVFTLGLGACTVAAGLLVLPWNPWGAGLFGAGTLLILVRAVFFVPFSFEISPGFLRIRYWLRTRILGRTRWIREDAYAAGGAVFFRVRLRYGARTVVLDEGHLRDPLRPLASWIHRQLAF